MDSAEDDISARVLLRRVLHTELPRSPVTTGANTVRRSMRIKNTPGLDSPGSALRSRLKKKLHESTSVSPLPSPKRRRSVMSKPDPPAVAPSPLFDEDVTTRGLLRGIIQMESDASLLMSGQPAPQEPETNSAESSVSSAGERTEGLSGVELSDLTLNTEPLTHVVKGLSRRKPQQAFNVSAFERQLPDNTEGVPHVFHGVDVPQEKSDVSQDLDFSAGSKSGLNLTLKTPFVEKHTERAGLQRKVSNRRLPSVDAFDEAVQRCLEQGPNQDHSEVLDGKTHDESSWQKFTLGLNDVTELYAQMKKDDTVGPSAGSERENQEKVSEIPGLLNSEHLSQEENEPPSEEEEVVPLSQEGGDVFLSSEYDIVLAPTQAMTGSLEVFKDENVFEVAHEEVVGEVEYENVVEIEDESNEEVEDENLDAPDYQERITRRAHRSEGGRAVLGNPAAMRVTKSFGAGLNPREKDLLDFFDESRGSLEDVHDEGEQGSASPPLYPAAEVTTSEQRSPQHEEDHLPESVDHDAPEEMSQTEEEEQRVKSETANQSPEPLQEEEEEVEEEIVESVQANQSPDPLQKEEEEEEEEKIMESQTANQSPEPLQEEEEEEEEEEEIVESVQASQSSEPPQEEEEEEEEEMMDSEPANHSTEPPQEEEQEEMMDSESANHSTEPPQEEEQEMIDSEPANQSPESPEEEDDEEDDDTLSAELSVKTPAFIKQKRVYSSPVRALPTVLKEVNAGPAPQATKRAARQKRQTEANVLPKSYVMSVFKHFAKTKVASDVYPAINEVLKKYFERLADDLEAYATHAKRKTIEVEDFELLMRRQGFVTDSTPVNILIEKYLPLEYRKLLIPVATSGNKVIPTQRR